LTKNRAISFIDISAHQTSGLERWCRKQGSWQPPSQGLFIAWGRGAEQGKRPWEQGWEVEKIVLKESGTNSKGTQTHTSEWWANK